VRSPLRSWFQAAALAVSLGGVVAARADPPLTQAPAAPTAVPLRLQIECAWLADPLTFPYSLQTTLQNGDLFLHGTVPSEAVRDRAIDIVRSLVSARIVNLITLDPTTARRSQPRQPEKLRQMLADRLTEVFPGLVRNIDIECDAAGRVLVNGTVASWADKRTVHQVLRDTPGCTSLVNRLVVGPVNTPSEVTPAKAEIVTNPRSNVLFAQPVTNDCTRALHAAVAKLCPKAKEIEVSQIGPYRFQIEIDAPNDYVGSCYATWIFHIDAFRDVHLDVLVHIK
jgi:hypothetical protein